MLELKSVSKEFKGTRIGIKGLCVNSLAIFKGSLVVLFIL